MPRVSRESLNSNYFHVIVQGIEKKYILDIYKLKEKYKELLMKNIEKYNVNLLSYCIMDNHAHMLMYTEDIKELSTLMKSVNTSYALYYNKLNNRVGYVFRSRYLSEPIKSQAQLYRTVSYIHLNPVSAKICKFPELYYFSSYNDFINKRGIANEECLNLLKFDVQNYIKEFVFMHYMHVEGLEYTEKLTKLEENEIIQEYINEYRINDIVFQSDKVIKMIEELKKKRISLSRIAKYFNISTQKLKNIISDKNA